MSVPPPNQPSPPPPSRGHRDREPSHEKGRSKKDFRLPSKKDEEEKKKSLFDLAGGQADIRELQEEIEQERAAATKEASAISATQTKAAMQAVSQLIQRLVAEMRVGEVNSKNFTSLDLKATPEIPQAFAGSNLTLSYQANSLVIHFDNFMTPQQENNAITLIEKNKEQLLEMVQALQAKNISLHELSIGKHVVQLPRVQPLPPPFQSPQAAGAETRREREEGGEGGEEGAGPE